MLCGTGYIILYKKRGGRRGRSPYIKLIMFFMIQLPLNSCNMDNKLQEEPIDWTESSPCPDTPPRMTRQDTLGAPTRLTRQTTVASPTPLTRQDSVAMPPPFARYDTIAAMPPPLTRQDTIGVHQGTPRGLMRYDTIAAMPPPLTRQDTIGVHQGTPGGLMRYDTIAGFNKPLDPENQIRELRDQITIINEKLDRILLIIMK